MTIHNSQTTNKCELFIDTIDAFQDPDSIQNIDAVACQDTTGLSCSLDITIYSNGEPFNFELNVTDYFSMSNGGKTAK